MSKQFVPALMRVVIYDKEFRVKRTYTTYQLTVPSQRPKNYKKGSGVRLRCDAMAIGEQLVYEQYIEGDVPYRGTCYIYRAPINGGCMVIVPTHMYRACDIDRLLDKERVWHSEEGWIVNA